MNILNQKMKFAKRNRYGRLNPQSLVPYYLWKNKVSKANGSVVENIEPDPEPGVDYSKMYFSVEALENGSIYCEIEGGSFRLNLSYSMDNGETWNSPPSDITINMQAGDIIMFKNSSDLSGTDLSFKLTKCNVYGNIMSLIYGDDFVGQTVIPESVTFASLFASCDIADASNLILPATTLPEGCYGGMFKNCTSLIEAPELPATTLSYECYYEMFMGCTSLTTAPELPATRLAESCYQSMFEDCTSLTTAPELPAITLAYGCYGNMFKGCRSLATAPEVLPATTLTGKCYMSMFEGCRSLTITPELPAITLEDSCYYGMFRACTSLTTAPELPATRLAESCYQSMFEDCASLTTAPELPAITLTIYCYMEMFYGCTSLNYIKCLAKDISAKGCTSDWVYNVSADGTFIKAIDMDRWERSDSGIPDLWSVSEE